MGGTKSGQTPTVSPWHDEDMGCRRFLWALPVAEAWWPRRWTNLAVAVVAGVGLAVLPAGYAGAQDDEVLVIEGDLEFTPELVSFFVDCEAGTAGPGQFAVVIENGVVTAQGAIEESSAVVTDFGGAADDAGFCSTEPGAVVECVSTVDYVFDVPAGVLAFENGSLSGDVSDSLTIFETLSGSNCSDDVGIDESEAFSLFLEGDVAADGQFSGTISGTDGEETGDFLILSGVVTTGSLDKATAPESDAGEAGPDGDQGAEELAGDDVEDNGDGSEPLAAGEGSDGEEEGGSAASEGGGGVDPAVVIAAAVAGVAVVGGGGALEVRRRRRKGPPSDDTSETEDDEEQSRVSLELIYPAGRSPFVFQYGWIFGARCIVDSPSGQQDLSDQVRWEGTAKFVPAVGRISRPEFVCKEGNPLLPGATSAATIVLSVEVDGTTTERTFTVGVVSVHGYARLSDLAQSPADAHGCPACPHPAIGPITNGSPNVTIGGLPAARVGDTGVHAACCGSNTYTITGGDPNVLINGQPAAMKGSTTSHCGGVGTVIQGYGG